MEIYGTTNFGGATIGGCSSGNGWGTVFSLSVGLGPFEEKQPTSGEVEAVVRILGTELTGGTSVSFNGTASVFAVVSSSEIVATVPSSTGPVLR